VDDRPEGRPSGPYVLLDVDYADGAFVLVLENIGSTPAFEPRVSFSKKLVGAGGEVVVSELSLWQRLTMLRPGKRIVVFLDAASLVFRRMRSPRFAATVTYRDDQGVTSQRRYDHDLSAYRDLPEIHH
jgi:hypothetical protein